MKAERTTHAVNALRAVHGFFLFWYLTAVILASGCAGNDFTALREGIESRGHYIEGVPFFQQKGNDCGPAAIAGVFAFRGRQMSVDEISARIYLPKLRGTLPMDMENFAREQGFVTRSSAGTMGELKTYIKQNIPVICLLDLGFGPYRRPHYVAAIGYDDVNAVIIAHDGVKPDSVMGYAKFEKAWSRAGRWMLVIRP